MLLSIFVSQRNTDAKLALRNRKEIGRCRPIEVQYTPGAPSDRSKLDRISKLESPDNKTLSNRKITRL